MSRQALARFGLKPDALISTFVKRLRCSECGSGSQANCRAGRCAEPPETPGLKKLLSVDELNKTPSVTETNT